MEGKQQHERRGQGNRHRSPVLFTAFDRAMISAEQTGKLVTFDFLGLEEAQITVNIVSVDKFFIEIQLPDGQTVWINKSMIAMARVEK